MKSWKKKKKIVRVWCAYVCVIELKTAIQYFLLTKKKQQEIEKEVENTRTQIHKMATKNWLKKARLPHLILFTILKEKNNANERVIQLKLLGVV